MHQPAPAIAAQVRQIRDLGDAVRATRTSPPIPPHTRIPPPTAESATRSPCATPLSRSARRARHGRRMGLHHSAPPDPPRTSPHLRPGQPDPGSTPTPSASTSLPEMPPTIRRWLTHDAPAGRAPAARASPEHIDLHRKATRHGNASSAPRPYRPDPINTYDHLVNVLLTRALLQLTRHHAIGRQTCPSPLGHHRGTDHEGPPAQATEPPDHSRQGSA